MAIHRGSLFKDLGVKTSIGLAQQPTHLGTGFYATAMVVRHDRPGCGYYGSRVGFFV